MGINSKGEPFLESLIRYGNRYQMDKMSSQNSLFGDEEMAEIPTPEIPAAEEWSSLTRLNRERELVGIYLSAHPLDEYSLILNEFCNTTVSELADKNALAGRKITMGGLIPDEPRTGFSKNGKPYGFVMIEDFSGKSEISLFGNDWIQRKNYFIPGNFVYITGSCQPKRWDPNSYEFVINDVRLLSEVKENAIKSITLSMKIEELNDGFVEDLMQYIEKNPGQSKIYFNIRDTEQEFTLSLVSLNSTMNITQQFIDFIKKQPGIEYKLN
jgi:DNA polymerase-3 subunit alpha